MLPGHSHPLLWGPHGVRSPALPCHACLAMPCDDHNALLDLKLLDVSIANVLGISSSPVSGIVCCGCRLVGSLGLMPLTFLLPPALWIKVCGCQLPPSSKKTVASLKCVPFIRQPVGKILCNLGDVVQGLFMPSEIHNCGNDIKSTSCCGGRPQSQRGRSCGSTLR